MEYPEFSLKLLSTVHSKNRETKLNKAIVTNDSDPTELYYPLSGKILEPVYRLND
jgi:hypothetical protein